MRQRFSVRLSDHDLRLPDRKREYTRRVFAEVALRYRVVTWLLSFGQDHRWKRRLVRRLPAEGGRPPVVNLLDLATGTGDIAFLLERRFPGARVVGIDLSPRMLRRARRAAVRRHSRVEFQLADLSRLPFPAGCFDVVTGGYALRNAPRLDQALAEIRRVLRPGGTAAFLEFSTSSRSRLRRLQLRLLRLWGGLWGWLLHGNPEVYAYIAASLSLFPHAGLLHRVLRAAGFRAVRSRPQMAGFTRLTQCSR